MPIDLVQAGSQGLQKALQGMEQSASRIAGIGVSVEDSAATTAAPVPEASAIAQTAGSETVDLAESLIDLKLYSLQAGASAKVVETGNEVIGTLLNIRG